MNPGPDADPPAGLPSLRASDADRERAVELLRTAGGDGRLDVDELDARVSAAYGARTLAELEPLTADLAAPPGTRPAASTAGVTVRPGPDGTGTIVSVMSGHERRGRWRVAARLRVLCFMGGAELDLCDAELSDPHTEIRIVTIMGGAELRVPSGVDVRVSKFAFMGGHDVTLDLEPPPPGAPVIHVRLFSLMGGAEVRQGRRPPLPEHRRGSIERGERAR